MNRWKNTDSGSIVAADTDADANADDTAMIGRQADRQMSIRKDTEGDFDAAAYAAKYTDADADDAANGDDTSDADDTADKK